MFIAILILYDKTQSYPQGLVICIRVCLCVYIFLYIKIQQHPLFKKSKMRRILLKAFWENLCSQFSCQRFSKLLFLLAKMFRIPRKSWDEPFPLRAVALGGKKKKLRSFQRLEIFETVFFADFLN